MKNLLSFFGIIAISVLLFISCSEEKKDKFGKIKNIVGSWQSFNGMNIGEQYFIENDSTISGKTFMLRDNDTIPLENISITSRNGKIYYSPTVLGQNNNKEIQFEFKKDSANFVFFENKSHDFPQRIAYHFVNHDSLYAFIDGNSSGVYMKNEFFYKRTK